MRGTFPLAKQTPDCLLPYRRENLPMWRLEFCAASLRSRLDLTGYPGLSGAWALVGLFGEVLRVVEIEGQPGVCLHHPSGKATLCVPPGQPYALTHECAHALLSNGLACYLEPYLPSSAKIECWKAEAAADRFARAFLIPPEFCCGSDWDVAELSDCPICVVKERKKDLRFLFRGVEA